MKKLVVLGLVAGLIAGSLAAPAGAAKKKKKKKPPAAPVSVDAKFFLRQDATPCSASHEHLSLTDGTDLVCFYTTGGAANEARAQTTGPIITDWAVEEGVPFVFDTAKKITGEITVRGGDLDTGVAGSTGPVSAGQARFDLAVVAEIGGEEKEIGAVSETWMTVPGDVHLVKLDLAIDPAFAGQQVTAFRIDTQLRGVSIGPHSIELEDPASFLVVPTLVTQ